jgi:hypothetical protein
MRRFSVRLVAVLVASVVTESDISSAGPPLCERGPSGADHQAGSGSPSEQLRDLLPDADAMTPNILGAVWVEPFQTATG